MPLVVFILIAILAAVMFSWTPFGIGLYLIGTNQTAAGFSGIRINSVLLRTYMITGLLAGAAGILMIARTNSAKADYGSSYLLQAVLVAILGGVNPAGGFGSITGLVISLLSLQFLSSGFNMLRFSNFIKEFTWGSFLITVMTINYVSNIYHSRRKVNTQIVNRKGHTNHFVINKGKEK